MTLDILWRDSAVSLLNGICEGYELKHYHYDTFSFEME